VFDVKGINFRKVLIAACVISPLVLFGAVAVLADVWSGPANRTSAGSCTLHHYHSGSLVCSEPCGEPEYNICTSACANAGGCDSSSTENNPGHSLPDATVSGSTSCTSPGNNGWCKGTGTLSLSGSEPVSGYHINGFDSDLYGPLCSGSSCDWNFPQGVTTNLGYWANSSFGDQSDEAYASMSVDSVAPTLTLTISSPNGSNGWNKSGPATASASATDANSGVASVGINGGGASFTASTDGVYNLSATAADKAGNTATTSGTVRLDTTPPTLSVSPSAPDGANNWYVSPAVLTATDSDATSGIASTQYKVDGGAWQNGSSFNEGVDGTHTIVFRATDVAGNTTTAAPVTVTVDRTPPVPDASMNPASPNGSNGWYVSPVTVTANSSDATSGLASQAVSLDGSTWKTSITISTDGVNTAQVTAKDNAGNTASTTKTIRLDTTPPTAVFQIPAADGSNGWYVSPMTVSVKGTDVTSGVASQMVSLDGSTWTSSLTISMDGTYSLHGRVTDNAGNITTLAPITIQVDRTPPIPGVSLSPAVPNGANGWYISPVTATANSSDVTSGIASQAVSMDGSTWKPSVSISTDGTYTLQIQASDHAGNTASASKMIRLDTTPPSASFVLPMADGENGWYLSPVTISVNGTDAGSGVASQMVSLDGLTWSSSLALSMDGVYTIHGRVTDNAGNTTNILQTVSIDHTPPVPDASLSPASPDGDNGWYVSPVTITANSSDVTSGISSQGVSLDRTNWKPSITLATDGTYTVQVQAQDKAGNTASTTKPIKLDITPPTASFQAPLADGSNGWYISPMTISAVGADATSGVASQMVSLDGSTWVSSLTLSDDGNYTVQGRVTDNAGNVTDISRPIHIDHTPPVVGTPVLTGTTGLAGWYTSSIGVSVSATDATSGVASTEYSVDGNAWQTTTPTLSDGQHTVQIKVTDNAGNVSTTSASAKVDVTPPVSAFTSPAEGSTVQVSGNHVYHLTGATSDPTSGVSETQISLDGGTTWQSLPLGSGGAWSEDWNGLRSNGTYTIEVRASDNAGNQEHTAKVTLVVGNQAPSVSITPLWLDFGTASVSFKSGSLPIAGARITVSDPLGRWPSAVFDYSGSNLPGKFAWLGRMGDGSIAYVGKYDVTVRVWDSFGNTGTASAWVIIPLPPAQATPTSTPTATKTLAMPVASSTPVRPAVTAAPTPMPARPVPKPVPAVPVAKLAPVSGWPALFALCLLVLFLSLSLLDPRPAAWRRLARSRSNPKS
jgi:large repetitive protein